MNTFKNPILVVLIVLNSFVSIGQVDSIGQGEVVSYSYSGATEDSSYYNYYEGQFSSFEYPSCKGFSLNVVFSKHGDYRLSKSYGSSVNYNYDSISTTMNINVEPNFNGSHDYSNTRIEILKFYFGL